MQLSARLALKFDFTHPDVVSRLNGIDFTDFARLLGLVRRRRDIFESRLNSPEDFNGSRYVLSSDFPSDPYSCFYEVLPTRVVFVKQSSMTQHGASSAWCLFENLRSVLPEIPSEVKNFYSGRRPLLA